MKNITNNEMLFVLTLFKNPNREYNASNIAKHMGISPMGALKIAKRLEKENILISKKLGKAVFYRLNTENNYTEQYIKFLLKRECELSNLYTKIWINKIKKIKNSDSAILFGSLLKKYKEAGDIDVLFITNKENFSKLKKEIEEINLINIKKIHPIYQTKEDFKNNILKNDKIILNAMKGIIVFGEDLIVKLIEK